MFYRMSSIFVHGKNTKGLSQLHNHFPFIAPHSPTKSARESDKQCMRCFHLRTGVVHSVMNLSWLTWIHCKSPSSTVASRRLSVSNNIDTNFTVLGLTDRLELHADDNVSSYFGYYCLIPNMRQLHIVRGTLRGTGRKAIFAALYRRSQHVMS